MSGSRAAQESCRAHRGFAKAVSDDALGDVDLVLAGDPKGDGFHSNVEDLHASVKAKGLGERVHFPGFVPDEFCPRSIPTRWRS